MVNTSIYNALKISKEFKVGVIFVACILLLYWGVNFLTGTDILSSSKLVYGVYEHTQGLDAGRPVNINGNRVGVVQKIDFKPDFSGELIVTFEMTTDYPIPSNSMAVINGDVLGNKRVDIILGSGEEFISAGDTIPTGVQPGLTEAVNEQLAPLKAKTERLLGSLDTALAVFQGFLNEETERDFRNSFSNLNKSFTNLESISHELDVYVKGNRQRFETITANLESITTNFADNGGKLDSIFSNLNSITDTLAKARIAETMNSLAAATKTANELLMKANNGEGTLGQLMTDEELYKNLTEAAENLDRLLLDLRYNPNRYIEFSIFGSSPRYSAEEIDEMEAEREQNKTESSEN